MAEQSTGVKYAISIDDTELRKAAQESAKAFEDIAYQAVRSGEKMDSIFDKAAASAAGAVDDFASLSDQIKFQKDIIAGLEKDLKVLEEAYKNAAPGRDWADAVSKFNSAKAELLGEKQALEELEAQAKNTANSQVSMRTRMREVREELIALEAAGKRGTEEYRKLQEEAGKLQDAYADASAQMRIMAHDQRGLQGIISGLTGLSAAFSAASGVVGLFTKDNEKLQQAMLRVQSLMSITVGLQQLQQTLNKDSAFRLVIINGLKDWWTKATEKATAAMVAEAAATKAAGAAAATSAGFFRTLGVALKGLSAGAITAILAAMAAIGVIVAKLVKGEKQISGELKRQREYINGVREARVEAQKATYKEVIAMEQSVARLGTIRKGTEEYSIAVKDIADKLGVQYDWLVKNTDKVNDLAKAWRDVKIAQAMGDAYLNKASSIKADTLAAIAKLQTLKDSGDARDVLGQLGFVDSKFIENYVKLVHNFRQSGGAAYGVTKERVWEMIKDMENQLIALADAQAAKYIGEFNKEIDRQTKAMKPIAEAQSEAERQNKNNEAAKRAREIKKEEYDAAAKELAEGEKKLDEYRDKLQRKYTENDIASKKDSTQRRLMEIKDSEEQELNALKEFGEKVLEQERENAKNRALITGEAYDEKTVTLPEGFQQMLDLVTKQVTENAKRQRDAVIKESRRAYEELAAEYADLEGKIAAIREKYDKQLETAAGDSSLASRIRESQRREIAALVLDSFKAEESIGKVAEQVQSLGKAARSALQNNLQKIVDFVAKKRNFGFIDKQDIADFAALNGVSEEFLQSLIDSDEAFEKFMQYVRDMSKETAEPIDNITKAIKAYKKAMEQAKSGDIIDINNLENAEKTLKEMIQGLADNILGEISSIGSALREIGEIIGNSDLQVAGDALDDIVGNIQAAESGAQAWGGWWGAIIGGLTDLIPKIVKWATYGEATVDNLRKSIEAFGASIDYYKDIADSGSSWSARDYYGSYEKIDEISRRLKELERKSYFASGKKLKEIWDEYNGLTEKLEQILRQGAEHITPEEAYNKVIEGYSDEIKAQRQLIVELSKHPRKNADEIKEALRQLGDLVQEQADYIMQYAESIVGVTSDQLFSDIYGMISDAFDAGKDSIDDFEAYYNRMVRNMVKTNLLKNVIESALSDSIQEMSGWMRAYMRGDIDADTLREKLSAVGDVINYTSNQALDALNGLEGFWESFPDIEGIDAASRGIATASQDSIDELNGRMTVVQANTSELLENSALNLQYTSSILSVVTNIKNDTWAMRNDIGDMLSEVRSIHTIVNGL